MGERGRLSTGPEASRPNYVFGASRPPPHPRHFGCGCFAPLPAPVLLSPLQLVEVLGRYSNLHDQEERIQDLLGMVPERPSGAHPRTPRHVQHRLNADEVDKLVKRYRAGDKVGELASCFAVHRDTVSEILDRHGVARRQKGLASELLSQTIARYRAGSSLATIGAEMSVNPATVALALRKAGIPLRPRRGWSARNFPMR